MIIVFTFNASATLLTVFLLSTTAFIVSLTVWELDWIKLVVTGTCSFNTSNAA